MDRARHIALSGGRRGRSGDGEVWTTPTTLWVTAPGHGEGPLGVSVRGALPDRRPCAPDGSGTGGRSDGAAPPRHPAATSGGTCRGRGGDDPTLGVLAGLCVVIRSSPGRPAEVVRRSPSGPGPAGPAPPGTRRGGSPCGGRCVRRGRWKSSRPPATTAARVCAGEFSSTAGCTRCPQRHLQDHAVFTGLCTESVDDGAVPWGAGRVRRACATGTAAARSVVPGSGPLGVSVRGASPRPRPRRAVRPGRRAGGAPRRAGSTARGS